MIVHIQDRNLHFDIRNLQFKNIFLSRILALERKWGRSVN